MKKRKVLIVSPVATHPPFRGNRQRILQVANLFRDSGYEIELAIGWNRRIVSGARKFWPVIHRLRKAPRWRPTRRIVPFDGWYTPGLGEEVRELVLKSGIDIVVLNYIFHSKMMEHLPANVLRIIDTHDVFTNRHLMYESQEFSRGFFSCTELDEGLYLARADFVLSISRDDTEEFKRINRDVRVVDLPFFPPQASRDTPKKWSSKNPGALDRPRIVGMVMTANDLNLDSLRQFIQVVDELVGPDLGFSVKVVGNVDLRAFRLFPWRARYFRRAWLEYLGECTDLEAFYDSVDMVVIPALYGTGQSVRFAEAVSRGLPIVSTGIASRGIPSLTDHQKFDNLGDLVLFLNSTCPERWPLGAQQDQTAQQWLRSKVKTGFKQLEYLARQNGSAVPEK